MGLLTALRKYRYPQSTDAFNPPLHIKQLADDVDAWTGINVSPIVADSTERDAKFPSPTQGMRVFRKDLNYEERYSEAFNVTTNPGGAVPAGWYPVPGTVLAMANNPTNYTMPGPSTVTVIPNFSAVGYTPNTPVQIEVFVQLINALSGADRTTFLQVFEDGVAIGFARSWVNAYVAGSVLELVGFQLYRTPSAGVHTYTVRGYASAANAIVVAEALIRVSAVTPKA